MVSFMRYQWNQDHSWSLPHGHWLFDTVYTLCDIRIDFVPWKNRINCVFPVLTTQGGHRVTKTITIQSVDWGGGSDCLWQEEWDATWRWRKKRWMRCGSGIAFAAKRSLFSIYLFICRQQKGKRKKDGWHTTKFWSKTTKYVQTQRHITVC